MKRVAHVAPHREQGLVGVVRDLGVLHVAGFQIGQIACPRARLQRVQDEEIPARIETDFKKVIRLVLPSCEDDLRLGGVERLTLRRIEFWKEGCPSQANDTENDDRAPGNGETACSTVAHDACLPYRGAGGWAGEIEVVGNSSMACRVYRRG